MYKRQTLPSAILMTAFAYGAGELHGPIGSGMLHGLKLVAVAIVAQAVWGMAGTLCPDRARASIACVAAVILLFGDSSIAQIGVILMGGIAGFWLCRASAPTVERPLGMPVTRRLGIMALAAFFGLLAVLPVLAIRCLLYTSVITRSTRRRRARQKPLPVDSSV